MSTTLIKLKKSAVAGKVPTTGNLDYGELALNYADGKLYYKNSANAIKSFGDSALTETLFDSKFDGKTTSDLTEGGNLYYTTARADSDAKNSISVTDAGGDGSLAYDAGTGVITYTGPSASEVRAHFTAGANVNIVGGKVALDSALESPIQYADFRPADPVAYSEGRLFYHSEYKAFTYYNDVDSAALQIGFEEWVRVYNNTGSTILNGTPVYVTGALGETMTIAPADATTEMKARAIGVATHNILDASEGVVTIRGLVSGIDTSTLTAGQPIHLGPGGSIQNNAPTYPYYPTDLGTAIVSDSSNGYLYINPTLHTYKQFRVTGNQHVDGNLTVDGDLTITGTQSVVSQANLAVDNSFIYTNSGDTIDSDTFTGSGLDDLTFTGHYNGTASTKTFSVRIDAIGTPDTFEWSNDNFSTTEATGVAITGGAQLLEDGINVNFNATTGHTINDRWDGTASPVNVDAGFASNRNTGTTGIGYTHMGMFFDVSDEKWKLFKSYAPEPEGTIDTGDASYEKATLDANLTGDVTGNLTGNVTGTASDATALGGFTADQFLRSDTADTKTSGDLSFSDGVKAIFGAGSDLQIYHSGSNSHITEGGTGNLIIRADDFRVQSNAGEEYIAADANGAVSLRYDNAQKLTTTPTGVAVTGVATANRFTPTAAIQSTEVTFGVYASGAWVNSPTGTNAYLGTAGSGILRWNASGVDVTGTLNVTSTAQATAFRVADTGIIDDATATTTSTSATAIDSWSASTYGGGKLIVEAKDGVNRHIVELLVTHDGTTAIATEYGTVATSGVLATYEVDISGGNVRVLATPASTNSTSFKVMRTTMFA